MNHSFEFIVVKRNRIQRSCRLNTVQQVARDKCWKRVGKLSLRKAIGVQSRSAVKRWMRFRSCVLREKISSQSLIQQ